MGDKSPIQILFYGFIHLWSVLQEFGDDRNGETNITWCGMGIAPPPPSSVRKGMGDRELDLLPP
jgi:hypothetical protein